MRVLLLVQDFLPTLNSTALLFYELGEDLAKAGYNVTVLTRAPARYLPLGKRQNARFLTRETMGPLQVWRVGGMLMPQRVPLFRAIEQFWIGFIALLLGLRLPRQDAVIVYSPPLLLTLAGYLLARHWRAVAIVNVQDLYPETAIDLRLLRSRTLIALARQLATFIYRRADAITVHSKGNRERIIRNGGDPERVYIIPNWVDLTKIMPGPRMNGWRSIHGLDDKFIISFAGTMGFAQGLEDVLKVAYSLRHHQDLVFVLAGDGVFRPVLERSAREQGLTNVYFLPPQPPDTYVDLLQASDVCLVTLHKELKTPVVPGKLQSIMAAGRPVILYANHTTDGRLILEEAKCGLFVPAGDVEAMAEAVLTLHRDQQLVWEMGEKGRKYAEQHFERKRCTGRYLEILSSLTKKEGKL